MKDIILLRPDITTLEALLKMDDPEVRLHIREGVIQTIAKKHLKHGISAELNAFVGATLKTEIRDALAEIFDGQSLSTGAMLTETYRARIKATVQHEFNEAMADIVQKAKAEAEKTVAQRLKLHHQQIENIVAQQLSKVQNEVVAEQVRSKVRDALAAADAVIAAPDA